MTPILADVTVPWGDWVTGAINVLQPLATLALTGVATYLVAAVVPPWLRAFTGSAVQNAVNEVLEKAVNSAAARAKTAVSGQSTTIPIGNKILNDAMTYAVEQAPAVVKTASKDSVQNLSNMVMARMEKAGVPLPDDPKKAVDEGGKFDFNGTITDALSGKAK